MYHKDLVNRLCFRVPDKEYDFLVQLSQERNIPISVLVSR